MTRSYSMALLGATLVVLACDDPQPLAPTVDSAARSAQAPSDGSGNKFVFQYDQFTTVNCGAENLIRHDVGWFQVRVFRQPNNRNVELDVFHAAITYTNSAGETFVWHDVGPDHYYVDGNGDFILTIT
ncbi:MAG: hypothetical protein LC674_04665, partial [Actinobacteria bacterium]|nr:hypothetical protein [Actinomycetota bacterium]